MAEQESDELSAGSSECSSKCSSTDESDESNSCHLEFTKWLAALQENLRVTQATCLDLKSEIRLEEAAQIYRFLPHSQVVDLNIECNKNLKGGVEDLLQLLVTSQIKKLSLCSCILSKKKFLDLMEVLKNTHVTELIINCENCTKGGRNYCGFGHDEKFDSDETTEFMSHMLGSRFTRLDCHIPCVVIPLLCNVQNTSITYLNASNTFIPTNALSLLFSTLHCTAITTLKLCDRKISKDDLIQLSLNLRDSNVVNLDLSNNNMSDAGLDILSEGLAHSKIRSLDISLNRIVGSNSFGLCLKNSQISNLNLYFNHITSDKLLSFPQSLRHSSIVKLDMHYCRMSDEICQHLIKSLRFSKVMHLNLSHNQLGLLSITELAAVLKDTALNSVDFEDSLRPEGVILLGDCLESSKLKSIKISRRVPRNASDFLPASCTFLERTKDSSLEILEILSRRSRPFDSEGLLKSIAASFVSTTFTHLHLQLRSSILHLAPLLKFTAITHLNLAENELGNGGAETLARCIPETQIIELILQLNDISDYGAKALASCLKRSKLVHLDFSGNPIQNEGLEALALHAQGTFLKILKVTSCRGNRDSLIDRILLENRTSVHSFVSFFKQIAPDFNENSFRFHNIIDDKNIDIFLEECLLFYKTILEQSSAASVLVAENSLSFLAVGRYSFFEWEPQSFSFSLEKCDTLLREEFPRQFTAFVATQIEAIPAQHVSLLRRAEELELTKIVELLLLNRPAFMIDQDAGIIHPYVYQLLHKYNQPLYSSVEPEGKTKIIKYFTEHLDLDGASDVINILNSKCKRDT